MIKALIITDASGLILISISQLLILVAVFTDYEKSRILMAFSIIFALVGIIVAFISTWYYGL